ncbi:hypothetical protein JG687_00010310 [Phytophthora cactorum]|uniref:Uncharacterized protein n=2 Tax=Phytophthora cactorum TaxID=29920 RepID=A0A8T1UBH2_9STRA|nr:hypothetical protein JG687_00010310 [Phytophthora cactorum]
MSAGRSVWSRSGSSAAAVASATSPVAVKLHDVMDEELAVKLQREEQEQWEREMEGRFGGEDRQTGWCFVEVPSSSSGHGVMSVIQQEVTVEDAQEDNDPDYTFALELQAHEAEEYDRMRRQEASSMERIRVIRQEDPKREEVRQTLQQYYDREAHREFDRDDPVEVHTVHYGTDMPVSHSVAAVSAGGAKLTPSFERPRLGDPDVVHDVYLDGAGWRVPKKPATKQSDRKSRHYRSMNTASSSGSTLATPMIRTPVPATATATSTPARQDDHDEWDAVADSASVASSDARAPGSISIAARPQTPSDVDGATRAMQDLRILQPPPAVDDGGNYPQQQFNNSVLVGTATASAHGPLDPVLVAGLENARERMTLLKFEDQIVRFLKNPREPHLNFPPLSSYHRLIVHRLAQRCGLEHQTGDYNPYENSSARVVTLFKTAQSAVPRVLLIDLSADRQTPTVTPASAPRIMMRKRSASRPGANGGRGNGADKATPSLQDRERAYAEARARIFGEDNGNTAAESVSSSSPSSTTSSAHETSGSGPSTYNNGPRYGSRQAAGPDGSRGFGRGRGAVSSSGNASGSHSRSPKGRPSGSDSNEHSRSLPSAPNAANWKESKVLWRNREQELNDPDFTRNHDAFRPRSSGGASSGSGSGGESPHYGNRFGGMGRYGPGEFQSQQFDRSYDRSYGYQQTGGAPPPPPPMPMGSGRGRYHVGGPDYNNRVDTNQYQRSPHQQYHPQQQFQQHQLNPPPSMVMGRGGYGYPSPQGRPSARQGNWVPPHANTRAVGNGSGGFIEDDFPPLGK